MKIPRLTVSGGVRRAVVGLGLGLAVAALLWLLRQTDGFEHVELSLVDVRTRRAIEGGRGPDSRIVLAVVQENDIRDMLAMAGESWPWNEDLVQYLPRCLEAAGAAGLVVDMVYLDRAHDPAELSDEVRKVRAGGLGDVPAPDSQLAAEHAAMATYADALRGLGSAVLGFQLSETPLWETPGRVALARDLAFVAVRGAPPPNPIASDGADLSVRPLLASGCELGFVNAAPDLDGVARQAAPVSRWRGTPVPSLSLAAARMLEPDVRASSDHVRVGDATQRLGEDGRFLINFRASSGPGYSEVNPVSLIRWGAQLAEGQSLPQEAVDLLEGKVVVFGVNILFNEDEIGTPVADRMPGPILQATMLDNLLHGDGRVRVGQRTNALVLFGLCAILGLFGALARRRLLPVAVAGVVALGLGWAGESLFRRGWSMDLFTPWLGIGLTALATTGTRLFTEGRRNKWLQGTFSRYLAPDVIESLKQDPSRLQLGGRRRELTILFSDVAGFTSISERLKPDQTVRLVNRYLTAQSDEVMREGGVIDKFEGDAIMAFWGDPLDMDDHAVRACRAAVRCVRALPALKPVLNDLGIPDFSIRVGLNTGTVLVGNMGSKQRFDYTCMGDAVNLASRLEGANKHFGSVILLGAATYEQAKDHILAKPLADLVVVGKSEPVAVYELVSLVEDAGEAERAHVRAFTRAHECLRADDLSGAREALREASEQAPNDGPCTWLKTQIDALEAGTVPRPWDGRVTLTHK